MNLLSAMSTASSSATTFGALLAAWLGTYLIHSTVLLLGACWLTRRLGRRHLGLADLTWKTALLGGLLTTTLQVGLGGAFGQQPLFGQLALEPVDALAATTSTGLAAGKTDVGGSVASLATAALPPDTSTATGDPRQQRVMVASQSIRLVLIVWGVGALIALLPLFAALRRLQHLLADRRPLAGQALAAVRELESRTAPLPRPAALSTAHQLAVPIACGWQRPEICLPSRAVDDLSADELRAVVAHELAHLTRRDPVWLLGGELLAALLWLQPLNRLALRKLRIGAELICDDWATAQGIAPISFARGLRRVAGWALGAAALEPGANRQRLSVLPVPGMADRTDQLVLRARRVLNGERSSRTPRLAGAAALVVLGLTALTFPGVSSASLIGATVGATEKSSRAGRAAPADNAVGRAKAGTPAAGSCWEVDDQGEAVEVECPTYAHERGRAALEPWDGLPDTAPPPSAGDGNDAGPSLRSHAGSAARLRQYERELEEQARAFAARSLEDRRLADLSRIEREMAAQREVRERELGQFERFEQSAARQLLERQAQLHRELTEHLRGTRTDLRELAAARAEAAVELDRQLAPLRDLAVLERRQRAGAVGRPAPPAPPSPAIAPARPSRPTLASPPSPAPAPPALRSGGGARATAPTPPRPPTPPRVVAPPAWPGTAAAELAAAHRALAEERAVLAAERLRLEAEWARLAAEREALEERAADDEP